MDLAYRRDIDGLRAVAVILVIGFHAFPQVFRAGFIGVDIFFVISGYLISGIIYADLDRKAFSIVQFYHRRARRILPALLTVIAASLVAGWLTMTPDELAGLGKHATAASLFAANWAYWLEAGYFDRAAALKPLLHLWSLGVEEQFYFLLPPLLWLIYRHPWRLPIVILVGLASFACNILYIALHRDVSSFFLPQARVWEFLAGTVLIFQQRQMHALSVHRALLNQIGSFAGFGLILASAYYAKESHYPGLWALAPIAGSALVIAGGPQAWINRHVLSARPIVFTGLISYSLYLWHWPVLVFPHIVNMGPLSIGTRVAAIAISVALAILSYRFVELPYRRRPANAAMSRELGTKVALVLTAALLAFANIGPTLPVWSLPHGESRILRSIGAWDFPNDNWKPAKIDGRPYYAMASGSKNEVVFIGDSNIEQYAPRIVALIKQDPQHTLSAAFITEEGCPPMPGIVKVVLPNCDYLKYALTYAKQSHVRTVVVGALWQVYIGDRSDKCIYTDAGPWAGQSVRSDGGKHAFDNLAAFLNELRALNKKMYLILPIPTGDEFDPQAMFERSPFSIKISDKGGATMEKVLAENGSIRAELTRIARDTGAILVDPMATLCLDGKCPAIAPDGEAMYGDKNHLSPFFVHDRATFIDPLMRGNEN